MEKFCQSEDEAFSGEALDIFDYRINGLRFNVNGFDLAFPMAPIHAGCRLGARAARLLISGITRTDPGE